MSTSEYGFGLIRTDTNDFFFNRTECNGRFEDLKQGQQVTFVEGKGRTGRPRAENIQLADADA